MAMLWNDSLKIADDLRNINMGLSDSVNILQPEANQMAPAAWQTWGIGLIIISITAFAPSVGILFVPLLSKAIYERFMTFLVALGVGTLSGSTIYVLIPQAFGIDVIEGLDYITKSSIIVLAIYAFFTVDRALAYLIHFKKMQSKRRKIHQSTLDAVMSDGSNEKKNVQMDKPLQPTINVGNNNDTIAVDEQLENEKNQLKNELEVAIVSNALTRTFSTRQRSAIIDAIRCGDKSINAPLDLNRQLSHISDVTSINEPNGFLKADVPSVNEPSNFLRTDSIYSRKSCRSMQKTINAEDNGAVHEDDKVSVSIEIVERTVIDTTELEVAIVAYMIIFGSSANNFVDGMSIGAAFSISFSKGLSVGIAVIAQQFPQELGTLAILVKSGLGFKRTILLNLIPNSLSFVGFITGVFVGSTDDAYEMYIFSISSGMYLYIFLGTLIPEIRDSVNELIKTDLKESILSSALQALGIAVGVSFMYVMCIHGHNIQI